MQSSFTNKALPSPSLLSFCLSFCLKARAGAFQGQINAPEVKDKAVLENTREAAHPDVKKLQKARQPWAGLACRASPGLPQV